MQTKKMSLANIKGKLSRAEMKNIMAGSGSGVCAITTSGPNYSNPQTTPIAFSGTNDISASANTYCVNLIATPGNGIYHCGYSCS